MLELDRSDLNPDALAQFEAWFHAAREANTPTPDAMTLATASKDGVPSARLVLLKHYDQRGFVFYTNYESQKARDLAENPRAALVFYWPDLERQVRIDGRVHKVTRRESKEYFGTRPVGSRLSAWASPQSSVVPDRETLERRVQNLHEEFSGGRIPLPPFWGGFRVVPRTFEFWQGRPDRLHDRFRYTRRRDDTWLIERLAP